MFLLTCILSLNYRRTYFRKVVRSWPLKVNKVYAINRPRRSSQRWRLWQQLNPRRVVLRYNTCRVENLVTHPRRVVRANRSESIVKPSEVHSTLEVRQREVLITPEVRDYATPVVCKNSLTNFSSSTPTLVVSKCSDVIPCKFKAVKFTIE